MGMSVTTDGNSVDVDDDSDEDNTSPFIHFNRIRMGIDVVVVVVEFGMSEEEDMVYICVCVFRVGSFLLVQRVGLSRYLSIYLYIILYTIYYIYIYNDNDDDDDGYYYTLRTTTAVVIVPKEGGVGRCLWGYHVIMDSILGRTTQYTHSPRSHIPYTIGVSIRVCWGKRQGFYDTTTTTDPRRNGNYLSSVVERNKCVHKEK